MQQECRRAEQDPHGGISLYTRLMQTPPPVRLLPALLLVLLLAGCGLLRGPSHASFVQEQLDMRGQPAQTVTIEASG